MLLRDEMCVVIEWMGVLFAAGHRGGATKRQLAESGNPARLCVERNSCAHAPMRIRIARCVSDSLRTFELMCEYARPCTTLMCSVSGGCSVYRCLNGCVVTVLCASTNGA